MQLKRLIQLTSLRLFQEFIYTIDSQYSDELFIKTTRYVSKTYEFILAIMCYVRLKCSLSEPNLVK